MGSIPALGGRTRQRPGDHLPILDLLSPNSNPSSISSAHPTPTQEITFADFRRELLESGEVDRIVIINKSKARPQLKVPCGLARSSSPCGHLQLQKPTCLPTATLWAREESPPPLGCRGRSGAGPQSPISPPVCHQAKVIMRGSVGGGQNVSYYFSLGNVSGFERKLEQAQEELSVSPREYLPVTYESETSWSSEAFKLAPTLLLIGFWIFMMRGAASSMGGSGGGGAMGKMFSVGKSKPTIIAKEKKTGVLFKDVAGLAEAKVEVMEVVDFLKNPEKYKSLGAKIPKVTPR